MFSLLSWILTGLIVGLIARALVPGRQAIGFVMTVILGIAGACLGGLLSTLFWPTWANDPNVDRMWPGWLMSILGGVLVLWGYVALMTDRSGTARV
jgi:uncharacterized membrane protein YeaQ/YmgE (transglycosylase-associated protein family)